ncbi:hypothetical protein QQF64_009796 [Cirrhinus molitorella]|uniref:Secreted protein n=1 Tax=Cirrhinus molitorella TaxID=172907 RepID=A0ABR3M262_9TELE
MVNVGRGCRAAERALLCGVVSGRAGCSSIVLLTSRGTCCHSTPTPPNPLRLALLEGVDPSCQPCPD